MSNPIPEALTKYIQGQSLEFTFSANTFADQELKLVTNIEGKRADYYFKTNQSQLTLKIPVKKTGFFNWKIFHKSNTKWKPASLDNQILKGDLQIDPDWIQSAIVYSVFVRFFKGRIKNQVDRYGGYYAKDGITSDELTTKSIDPALSILPGEGGTFDDVKAHLETLKSMGINTLYFNPIHSIGDIYRGYNMLDQLPAYLQPGSPYSIKDYKSIDPELTYDKDTGKHLLSDPQQEFRDLVKAAHEKNMYVIMDMVFNHTAHDFTLQRIRPEWYLYKEHFNNLDEPYLYPEDLKKGKPWGDAHHSMAPYDHGVWWDDCAQLNWEYKIPEAPNQPPPNTTLKEMWQYFKSIPKYWIKHFGIDGFRCDVAYRIPPRFWKECIQESRQEAQKDKNNLAGDVVFIAESYTNDLDVLQNAGFTAVYGDYSHKMGKVADLKPYLDHIYNIDTPTYPPNSKWLIFPDSHDFDRTPRKVLGHGEIQKDQALLANQSRWLITACLPGIPLIFNGFEKIEWQPINIWSYGAVDWEKDVDLKKFIAKINHIRNRLKPLQTGKYTYLNNNQNLDHNTQILSFMRYTKDQKVLIISNMDVINQAGPTVVYLPEEFDRAYSLHDELSGESYPRQGKELLVILKPGQSHIFSVEFKS